MAQEISRSALEAALAAHRGRVDALARAVARDASTADDLAQRTWLRAMESAPPGGAVTSGWLATVVRNLAIDDHRRAARRTAREFAAARREAAEPADASVQRAEARRILLDAVLSLDEPLRTVVMLRYFEDLPPRRIAEALHVDASIVRSRLHRAVAALRAALLRDDPDRRLLLALVPATASARPEPAGGFSGGLLVTTTKTVAAVAVLALLAWALLPCRPDDGASVAAMDPGDGRGAPAVAPPVERPRAARAEPDGTSEPAAPAPAPEPAAPAPGPSAKRSATRLAVEVLATLPAPPGKPAPAPEEPGEADDGIEDMREVETDRFGMVIDPGGAGWADVPERGAATWNIRVTDADGTAVAGARIFRIPADRVTGSPPVAPHRWTTGIGSTSADGTLSAARQPAGDFVVVADLRGRLSSDAGIAAANTPRVQSPPEGAVSGVVVRLPFRTAALGALRGRVLDEDGVPLASVIVSGGRDHSWTGTDGRWELAALDPGDCVVTADATGFAPFRTTIRVTAGATHEADLRPALVSAGTLEVSGRVLDDAGAPIPHVRVFLTDGAEGARYATADADGRYAFRRVPEEWAARDLSVMTLSLADRTTHLDGARDGIRAPDTHADIVLRRLVPLRLLLRSSAGAAPLQIYRLDVRAEFPGEPVRQLVTASQYSEEGVHELDAPRGRILLRVESPGHRGADVAIVVPDTDGPYEAEIVLTPE